MHMSTQGNFVLSVVIFDSSLITTALIVQCWEGVAQNHLWQRPGVTNADAPKVRAEIRPRDPKGPVLAQHLCQDDWISRFKMDNRLTHLLN